MARKKTIRARVDAKASLSRRLREVRQELFGEHGGPELARRMGLPARTWYNYETGVTVPAEVLLGFIDLTGANPRWLLSGEGPKYRSGDGAALAGLSPVELIRRGLEELELERAPHGAPGGLPGEAMSDYVAVGLVPLRDLVRNPTDPPRADEYVLAHRHWLPNPTATVGVRLDDDSMHPILPSGSIVAVDRTVVDPEELEGRIVAARPDGVDPVIRWLEVSGRHLILRPNQATREHPLIPVEIASRPAGLIVGQVVWSWSRFGGG